VRSQFLGDLVGQFVQRLDSPATDPLKPVAGLRYSAEITSSQPFLVGLARWQEMDHALERPLLAIESGVQQFGLEIPQRRV
jgi:hypothetical protein